MHPRALLAGTALAFSLALAGCNQKAAAPAPETKDQAEAKALAAGLTRLGLSGATFEGSERSGETLVLKGVRGESAGNGAVRAERVEAEGVPGRPDGLPASRVAATGVTGEGGKALAASVEARDVAPAGPEAVRSPAWKAEGVDAVVRGAPVKAASLTITPRANSVEVLARQATLGPSAFPPLPNGMADDLARLPSDIDMTLTWIENNSIEIRVDQWSSPLGRVQGSLVVGSADMGDPAPIAALAALPLQDLLNPSRWPDGVVLRGGALYGSVSHPGFAEAIASGGKLADPALRAVVDPLRERLRTGGDIFQLSLGLTRNIEVNKLGSYLTTDPKAQEGLGLKLETAPPPGREAGVPR